MYLTQTPRPAGPHVTDAAAANRGGARGTRHPGKDSSLPDIDVVDARLATAAY